MIDPVTTGEIQYLQHSATSTNVHNRDSLRWAITWRAPRSDAGKILFHIAANAGNGDASAFGDFIYVKEIEVKPFE